MLAELVIAGVSCFTVGVGCVVLVRRLEKSHSPLVASVVPDVEKVVEKAADAVDPSSSPSS